MSTKRPEQQPGEPWVDYAARLREWETAKCEARRGLRTKVENVNKHAGDPGTASSICEDAENGMAVYMSRGCLIVADPDDPNDKTAYYLGRVASWDTHPTSWYSNTATTWTWKQRGCHGVLGRASGTLGDFRRHVDGGRS